MTEFDRSYATVEEQVHREQVFLKNLELIKRHNTDPSKTWYATVNEYADWTNEEFRAHRTGVKPPEPMMVTYAPRRSERDSRMTTD